MPKNTLLVLSFLIFKLFVSGFNVDVNFPIIHEDPSVDKFERRSYFGYSVLLNNSWISIGAPRANYSTVKLKEPGVAYRCDIIGNCREINLQEAEHASRNASDAEYYSNAWFGVAMDQSPSGQAVVCGHRWRTPFMIPAGPKLPGACYWFQDEKDVNFIRPIPGRETYDVIYESKNRRNYYKTSLSQSGMSVHILPTSRDREGIFFGSPGYLNWRGSVVQHERVQHGVAAQNRATGLDSHGFGSSVLGHSYLGYHVSSGCFEARYKCLLAVGAPRGPNEKKHMAGSVSLFDFPGKDKIFWNYFHSTSPPGYKLPDEKLKPYKMKKQVFGLQEGEYFGSSFAVADFTGDNLDDLIVGAPFHSVQGDEGRIYVYKGHQKDLLTGGSSVTGKKAGGRFGTAVASVGDLDRDGFQDIAVGAPYEGNGAVYIFHGNREGSLTSPTRITAEELSMKIKGFGVSFSGMADVDGNHYDDLAVGAFLSGHAVILRSRSVVTLKTRIDPEKQSLKTEEKLKVKMCLSYEGKGVPTQLNVTRKISADESYKRANPHYKEDKLTLRSGEEKCEDIIFFLKNDRGTLEPLKIKLSQELQRTRVEKKLINRKTDADKFDEQGPVEGKSVESEAEVSIPFTTKCGDRKCIVSLLLTCFLSRDGHYFNETFVIGNYDSLQLQVNIRNIGDPIYSSLVKVQLPVGISLKRKTSSCDDVKDNYIHCKLFTINNDSKPISLELDMTDMQLYPKDHEGIRHLQINVTTNSTADGIERVENLCTVPLNININASVDAYGKPQKDIYPLTRSDTKLEIIHMYEVYKKGYSPVRLFEIEFLFPAKILSSRGSAHIISSSVDGGFNIHCKGNQETAVEQMDSSELEDPGIAEVSRLKRSVGRASNNSNGYIPPANQTLYLNCSSSQDVLCDRIVCQGSDLQSRTLQLKLTLNITKLRHFMDQKNIIFLTTEAHVKSLYPKISKSLSGTVVSSPIIGEVQDIAIALWIYVASGVGGILLVMLLTMGLAKAGFFQRSVKAQLEALRQKETEAEPLEGKPSEMTSGDE